MVSILKGFGQMECQCNVSMSDQDLGDLCSNLYLDPFSFAPGDKGRTYYVSWTQMD